MTVRIVAPCRLHFGLLHVPIAGFDHWPDGRPVRKFGGLGVMIDGPNAIVEIGSRSGGNARVRASDFLKAIQTQRPEYRERIERLSLWAESPVEHIGLGVGTALGMAVARATFAALQMDLPYRELAQLVGRGQRSGIGIHGFESGGFLFDEGKLHDGDLPTIRERLTLPANWRIVLLPSQESSTWHGDRERSAFHRHRSVSEVQATTERLHSLAAQLLAALRANDFEAFSQTISEFNRVAGEPFARDQGGTYASATIGNVIQTVRDWGYAGVGQSSWGPTVFAFAENDVDAARLCELAKSQFAHLSEPIITRANDTGAIFV